MSTRKIREDFLFQSLVVPLDFTLLLISVFQNMRDPETRNNLAVNLDASRPLFPLLREFLSC